MPKFALSNLNYIKGQQSFEELVIDGIGQFELFINELKGTNYESDIRSIISIMDQKARLAHLPGKKWHQLSDPIGDIQEYEIKQGDLRVYLIEKKGGKIVVLGGYKNKQIADIRRFRSIKIQYLNSLKQ